SSARAIANLSMVQIREQGAGGRGQGADGCRASARVHACGRSSCRRENTTCAPPPAPCPLQCPHPIMQSRDRLIVAVDRSGRDDILRLAEALDGAAGILKIGLQAFIANGPSIVRELA